MRYETFAAAMGLLDLHNFKLAHQGDKMDESYYKKYNLWNFIQEGTIKVVGTSTGTPAYRLRLSE